MKKQFLIASLMLSSLAYSQVGINTPTPTNTLDVNGTARVRTVNQGVGTTVISPLYVDNTGVVVKSSTSATYGSVRSNTVTVASGGTGTLAGSVTDGVYRAVVTTGNGCAFSASVEFFISTNSANSYYGLNGQDGLIIATANNHPIFTQTSSSSVAVTWNSTSVPSCSDGSNSAALNFTLSMPAANTINVTNNGNTTKAYSITLTRIN
ncbi:hypothetical protein [Chryseobacterium sp. IT-36CA2]|uniref:hypothetical protein n=1 Tax=Chryseobacterium sp. IT-36CA2 TaxID=3026460 RepID=UPI0039E19A9C